MGVPGWLIQSHPPAPGEGNRQLAGWVNFGCPESGNQEHAVQGLRLARWRHGAAYGPCANPALWAGNVKWLLSPRSSHCRPRAAVTEPAPQRGRGATCYLVPRPQTHRNSRSPSTIVRRRRHSLKEMMPVGAIEPAAQHAAVLEISGQRGMGMGRCDRAFR